MAREFDLVETYDYDVFVNEVQRKLNEGWEFHGILIAFPDCETKEGVKSVRYLQAFVKESEANTN